MFFFRFAFFFCCCYRCCCCCCLLFSVANLQVYYRVMLSSLLSFLSSITDRKYRKKKQNWMNLNGCCDFIPLGFPSASTGATIEMQRKVAFSLIYFLLSKFPFFFSWNLRKKIKEREIFICFFFFFCFGSWVLRYCQCLMRKKSSFSPVAYLVFFFSFLSNKSFCLPPWKFWWVKRK